MLIAELMPTVHAPSYLRFLARWDQDEGALRQALAAVAGREVVFGDRGVPAEPGALFGLFARDPIAAVTENADGSLLLPYNPWRALRAIVEERYLGEVRQPLHARLGLPYHWVPGGLRLAAYPLIAGRSNHEPEECPPDPAWPIEPRLDGFRAELYRGLKSRNAAASGTKSRGAWPGGRRFPLMVTHDVDTKEGMALAGTVLDEMVALGIKPCFFLVGKGYRWDEGFIRAVHQAGGEIGLHGDTHDNRLAFEPSDVVARRLDSVSDLMKSANIRGFRSPSLLVSDALYEAVGPRFAWDSSVPDTDTHTLLGPRRGCGTAFPFRRRGCLVLPLTMPADDRLLLLDYRGLGLIDLLRRKWMHLREVGGLVHFLTHPEPHLFGKPVLRDLFRAVLTEILDSGEAWVATPSMVAEYWESLAGSEEPG